MSISGGQFSCALISEKFKAEETSVLSKSNAMALIFFNMEFIHKDYMVVIRCHWKQRSNYHIRLT